MKRINLALAIGLMGCFLPTAQAGVMEQLIIDENTGFIIGAKDYEEPPYIEPSDDTKSVASSSKEGGKASAQSSSNDSNPHSSIAGNTLARSVNSDSESPKKNAVHSSTIVTQVRQPKVIAPAAQNALLNTPYKYLMVKQDSKRVFVDKDDGLVYFQFRKGSLKENIIALLASTNAEMPVMKGISDNHRVPSTIWVSGENVIAVLEAMLISYDDPYPIVADPYTNRIVEVLYNVKG